MLEVYQEAPVAHRIIDTYLEPGIPSEGWVVGFIGANSRFVSRIYVDVTAGATPEEVVALAMPEILDRGRDFSTKHSGFPARAWIARRSN